MLSSQLVRGGFNRGQGAPNSGYGTGQQEIKTSMEDQPPANGEECDGGRFDPTRSNVGGIEKSMMGFYGGPNEGEGEEMADLGVGVSNSTKARSVRSGSNGVSNHAVVYVSKGEADEEMVSWIGWSLRVEAKALLPVDDKSTIELSHLVYNSMEL